LTDIQMFWEIKHIGCQA